jgi:hypothetical protein
VLTNHQGYLVTQLDQGSQERVVGLVNDLSQSWDDHYAEANSDSAYLGLTMADGTMRRIRIDSPDNNPDLPRSLRELLSAIGHWQVIGVINGESLLEPPLHLQARAVEQAAVNEPIYDIPADYPAEALLSAAGITVSVDDQLVQQWHLVESLLPVNNTRLIRDRAGVLYQLTTTVDWSVWDSNS